MRQAAIAGLAAGAAMMIGGALAAVSDRVDSKSLADSKPLADNSAEIMNPMIGGQAMLPDRDIMDNVSASPLHSTFVTALKDTGVFTALKSNGQFTVFAPPTPRSRPMDRSQNPRWRGA